MPYCGGARRYDLLANGRIDALFNVAGISGRRADDGPLHECTVGWDITMDTISKSILLCREVLNPDVGATDR